MRIFGVQSSRPWVAATALVGVCVSFGGQTARAQGVAMWSALRFPVNVVLAPRGVLPDTDRHDSSPLDRKLSINVRSTALDTVLAEIERKTGVQLVFNSHVVPLGRAVTMAIVNGTVRQALSAALEGTDIVVREAPNGAILLVRSPSSVRPVQGKGSVSGVVLDSATRQGIPAATVRIKDTKISVLTDEHGGFRLSDVPAGPQILMVRVLGYSAEQQPIRVVEDRLVTASFQLRATPTVLSGVVTMGNGDQRRIEVPNDITTIRVDSVMQHAAITNVTDLLATRVPGLTVIPTSGAVGAPSTIRIRGISSINGSNDPVVYLDGVRVPGPTTGNSTLGNGLTSRLNDIDVNSIESIEVLKGPSAAALYGTDAGNGVIVIRTKRAQPGVTHWGFSGSYATMNVPNTFPIAYTSWGHDASSTDPRICTPILFLFGQCVVQDSLVAFQLFKDPKFTSLGSGNTKGYSVNMMTGQGNVQYSMTGSFNNAIGAAKLPAYTQEALAAKFGAVPDWMRRPNTQQDYSVGGTISAQPSTMASVNISLTGTQLSTRNSGDGVSNANSDPTDTLYFAQSTLFNSRKAQDVSHVTIGVSPTVTPWPWLQLGGAFGTNLVSTTGTTMTDLRYALIPPFPGATNSVYMEKQSDQTYSANAQSSIRLPLTSSVTSATTFAGDYQRDNSSSATVLATGIPIESEDPTLATASPGLQSTLQSARVGWSMSETLSYVERLFLNVSIRGDRANTFGASSKHPIFPQWGASWLAISGAPELPIVSAINSLRLRVSYGMAANQPGPVDALANYQSAIFTLGGVDHAVLVPSSVGNSSLLPEKNTEIETGADLELFNSRVSMTATYSRKLSKNALVTRTLAPSAGFGGGSQIVNVGSVLNGSYELTLAATLLDRQLVTWRATTSAYATRNKLVSLGVGASAFGSASQRFVVGYPIDGTWVKPLLGYADLDGDGLLLSPGELVYGDSAVYAGWPLPKYTINYNNSFGFFRGRLTFDCNFDFQNGLTQTPRVHDLQAGVDFHAPLAEQAAAQGSGTVTVAALRWQNATVSWMLPTSLLRAVRAQSAHLSFSGTNLGLWSKYKGADPTISTSGGNTRVDAGILPPTRNWTMQLSLGY